MAQKQPDILNLHVEFLRACERLDSTISVTILKTGGATSTLQLQLSQNDKIRVIAIATSTNFDRPLGPSVPTGWTPRPAPRPKPDFDRALAHRPDDNWIPVRVDGEVIPFTGHILTLLPRAGHLVDGICDSWNGLTESEMMDATDMAFMTDMVPSMSDTLMRKGALYDSHEFWRKALQWAEKNPGVPAVLTNSVAEGAKFSTFNSTVTLDMTFKRRLPKEGLRYILTRTATKAFQDGRMDIDVTLFNEDMELICIARQLILVLESRRKFKSGKSESKM